MAHIWKFIFKAPELKYYCTKFNKYLLDHLQWTRKLIIMIKTIRQSLNTWGFLLYPPVIAMKILQSRLHYNIFHKKAYNTKQRCFLSYEFLLFLCLHPKSINELDIQTFCLTIQPVMGPYPPSSMWKWCTSP